MTLRYVTWETDQPIPLLAGQVEARGEAFPQVRDPLRAATAGDTGTLIAHIQAALVQSLIEVLQGMEPSLDQLIGLRDDVASTVLVSANMKLRSIGVTLLDLTIIEMKGESRITPAPPTSPDYA